MKIESLTLFNSGAMRRRKLDELYKYQITAEELRFSKYSLCSH